MSLFCFYLEREKATPVYRNSMTRVKEFIEDTKQNLIFQDVKKNKPENCSSWLIFFVYTNLYNIFIVLILQIKILKRLW